MAWLDSLGWYGRGGMGIVPLPAQEISAWSEGTGHRLEPWEFEAIHTASAEFVAEFYAENPKPPAIDEDDDTATEQTTKAKSVMSAFKNIAQKVNKTP